MKGFKHPCAQTCSGYQQAWQEALEEAIGAIERRSMDYFSQMEGQGEPEFSKAEFAFMAVRHCVDDIRAMIGGKAGTTTCKHSIPTDEWCFDCDPNTGVENRK